MEFKFGGVKNTDIGSYIAADNHFKNSEGWALTNGFQYHAVHSKSEFDSLIDKFVAPSEQPILIEIFTNPENERTATNLLSDANWIGGSIKEKMKHEMKDAVREVFGDQGFQFIKKVINK